jgi:hypothetical protein
LVPKCCSVESELVSAIVNAQLNGLGLWHTIPLCLKCDI